MKALRISLIVVAMLTSGISHLPALAQNQGSGTLLIFITGLDNYKGQLLVALYKCTDEFPGTEPSIGWGTIISKNEELIRFDQVPYGRYAVAVIHDINNDGKLDKNFVGIPVEGYGFSNNAMGRCGPPSFYDASFTFAQNYDTREIGMHYGIPK